MHMQTLFEKKCQHCVFSRGNMDLRVPTTKWLEPMAGSQVGSPGMTQTGTMSPSKPMEK